jgi:hypothetical protein
MSLKWLEPDTLPDEGFSDKSFSALPFYFAVAAHLSLRPSGRVTQRLPPKGQAVRTFPILAGRHLLFQGFMRPKAVVIFHPSTGAMLLALAGVGGRPSGFGFENPVHLLMRSIFFRMPRPDELCPNA